MGGVNHWAVGGVNHWAVGGVNHWAVLRRIQTLQLVQTCSTYVEADCADTHLRQVLKKGQEQVGLLPFTRLDQVQCLCSWCKCRTDR